MKTSEWWFGMFRAVIAPSFLTLMAICLPTIWMTKTAAVSYIVTVATGLGWLVWKIVVKNDLPRLFKRLGL